MKQLKSEEIFDDVICQNCISYNQGRCYEELPAIPTEQGNRCGKGYWLFNEEIINYRHCCFELLPFEFVNSVEDLICKNCSWTKPLCGGCGQMQ